MPVDEHVAKVLSAPNSIGVLWLPNLLNDYNNAKTTDVHLWAVVEVTGNQPNFEFKYAAMTEDEFKSTYRIDAHPEFPNDWFDVSKI